ncbi:MAG: hypothetical protein Q8Q12_12320 [bacterium]|nr:hypothetical protein [bacterium]
MSTPKELFNDVKAILAADSVLSGYVSHIYERERDNLDGSKKTVLMLEPSDVVEKSESYPLEATFVLVITGYMFESDPERAVNDGSEKKILDLEQDVKNALRPYYNLNGNCIAFKFASSKFDIKKYSWGNKEKLRRPPVYGVEIYMNIRYAPTFDYPGFGVSAYGFLPYGY